MFDFKEMKEFKENVILFEFASELKSYCSHLC